MLNSGLEVKYKTSWNDPLGDGVVTNTRYTCLLATCATGELLVAAIFPQPTAVASANIAKTTALAYLPGVGTIVVVGVVVEVVARLAMRGRLRIVRSKGRR